MNFTYFWKIIIIASIFSVDILSMDEQGDDDRFYPVIEKKVIYQDGDYPLVNKQISNLWMTDPSNVNLWDNIEDNWNDIRESLKSGLYLYKDEMNFLCAIEDDAKDLVHQYLKNRTFIKKAEPMTFIAAQNIALAKGNDPLWKKVNKVWRKRRLAEVMESK